MTLNVDATPPTVTGDGTLQPAPAGAVPTAAQVTVTAPLKLLIGASVSATVPYVPATSVSEEVVLPDASASAKSGIRPVPLSVLENVAEGTFVAKVTVPVLLPTAVGLKTTLAVHVLLIATVVQLFETAKSPVVVTPVTVTGASPVLVKVNTWPVDVRPTATLPKLPDVGVSVPESFGAGRTK